MILSLRNIFILKLLMRLDCIFDLLLGMLRLSSSEGRYFSKGFIKNLSMYT